MTTVPPNFPSRIIGLRLRLRITQAELARRIGAANKAVVYQWETRKRTPSIVSWSRIQHLADQYGIFKRGSGSPRSLVFPLTVQQ
jgi:transcriptional regulator with XRE-family HTH domain